MDPIVRSPEWRKAQSERMKKRWKEAGYKATMSRLARERWKCPEYRAKLTGKGTRGKQSPAQVAAFKEHMRSLWQDEKFVARMSQLCRELWADPDFRAKQAAARESQGFLLKRWADSLRLAKRPDIAENLRKGREKAHAAARARARKASA